MTERRPAQRFAVERKKLESIVSPPAGVRRSSSAPQTTQRNSSQRESHGCPDGLATLIGRTQVRPILLVRHADRIALLRSKRVAFHFPRCSPPEKIRRRPGQGPKRREDPCQTDDSRLRRDQRGPCMSQCCMWLCRRPDERGPRGVIPLMTPEFADRLTATNGPK